jgi:UDP-N-acetylmuramyl tripeptide synthase
MINVINNKKVLIIGAGNAGRPSANLLKFLGNQVVISELNEYQDLPLKAQKKIKILKKKGIIFEFGYHSTNSILWAEYVFISPNIPVNADIRKKISKFMEKGQIKEISAKDIGKILNSLINIPMIGIAGTDGKTTTTNMIYQSLADDYHPLIFSSLQDSLVIEGLVDLITSNKAQNSDLAVFELPHGTIRMVEGLEICVGILTNLTPDHMDEFSTFAEYTERNMSIKDLIHKNGVLVLNGDDPIISTKMSKAHQTIVFYGLNRYQDIEFEEKIYEHPKNFDLDVIAENISLKGLRGSKFTVHVGKIPTVICQNCGEICCTCNNLKREYVEPFSMELEIKLPGICNIENAVATIATLLIFGFGPDYIKSKIESFTGLRGRFEKIDTIDGVDMFIDAAHNPESMEKLLNGLMVEGKLIITIDNPDTLTERDKLKIGKTLGKYADVVIASAKNETTEELNMEAAETVIEGASNIDAYFTSYVCDAISQALKISAKGDIILHIGPGVVNAYEHVKSEIKKGINSYLNSKPKIVVIGGCGSVGSLMARVLKANGADVTVSDISEYCVTAETLKNEDINLDLGQHDDKVIKNADLIVIAPSLLENEDLIDKIREISDVDIISVDEVIDICKVDKPVIGITGTNGKTTTTWILKNILKQAGYNIPEHGLDIQGNTELIPPLQARLNGDLAVLEIGTFGNPNEIKKCALNSEVDIGIITNISKDHLKDNEDYSNYVKCKREMIDVANFIILNSDDPLVSSFALRKNLKNVLFYGIENLTHDPDPYPETRDCPVCNSELKYSDHYLGHLGLYKCSCGFKRIEPNVKACDVSKDCFKLVFGPKAAEIKLKKRGIWNVYNALAAASGALALKIDFEDIVKGIETFEGVEGRFDEINIDKKIIIDYAHNPAGVKAIIQTLNLEKPPNSNLIVVNTISSESGIKGDIEIAEILNDADAIIMASHSGRQAISKMGIDAYLTDSSIESSTNGTLGASEKQVKEGIRTALNIAKKNDIILIIGEGGVKYSKKILKNVNN